MIGKVINKNFEEIRNNLEVYENKMEFPKRPEGFKKENYVYDEEKSVKWNREHREELENEYRTKQDEYRIHGYDLELQFKHDMIRAAEAEYNLNYKQGEVIFNAAWEDGHADGLEEVVDQMIKRLEFYSEVKTLE